jgi:hypothetical protein
MELKKKVRFCLLILAPDRVCFFSSLFFLSFFLSFLSSLSFFSLFFFILSFLLSSLCLLFLSWRLFPEHFYSEDRVSLQCSEGIPCAFFISYPDGVCTVEAAAACGVQVISRHVSFTAIAASEDSIFAEDKLLCQVQVLFQIILFTFPAILFIEIQHLTQFIIRFIYI